MSDPPVGTDPRRPETSHGSRDLSELMEAIRRGSAEALQELMDQLWPELVRFAAWELGDPDTARDVVQEAFIHVWAHRLTWEPSATPRGYLYRIVRHRVIDERRRVRARSAWATREQLRPRRGPSTPAEEFAAARLHERFHTAVADLSNRRREAFNLVVLRGLSHREAAEVLDVSPQTVANQVSTALRQVRESLQASPTPEPESVPR